MSLVGDFLYVHFHEKIAAFLGASASVMAPGDIITKIITGTTTGVCIWIITKTISYIVKRIFKPCSKE